MKAVIPRAEPFGYLAAFVLDRQEVMRAARGNDHRRAVGFLRRVDRQAGLGNVADNRQPVRKHHFLFFLVPALRTWCTLRPERYDDLLRCIHGILLVLSNEGRGT